MLKNKKIRVAIIVSMIILTVIIIISFIPPKILQSIKNQTNFFSKFPTAKTNSKTNNSPIVNNTNQTKNLNNNSNIDNKNNIKQTGQKDQKDIISPTKILQQQTDQQINKETNSTKNNTVPNLSRKYLPRYRPVTIIPTIPSKSYDTNSPQMLADLFGLLFNFGAPVNSIDEFSVSQYLTQELSPQPTTTPIVTMDYLQKTGVYLMSEYSEGAKKIIVAKPQILKVMDPQFNTTLNAVKEYKKIFPGGNVILRFYEATRNMKYSISDDPVLSAQNFYQKVIASGLKLLGENKKLFDYIEAPNELDSTPGWESLENILWLTKFWEELVSLNAKSGIKTCIASIPVGNPPGSYEEIKTKFQIFLPALQKAQQHGGAICYHAYSLEYSQDTNKEIYSSLRYRLIHQAITEIDPNLSNLQFVLSEAGIDQNGNPQESGWQARGGVQQYMNWIDWFDGQINQDNYVIGATLYQIGDGYWSSFNLEPIAGWLAGRLK